MNTITSWRDPNGERHSALIYSILNFTADDAAGGICIAVKRGSGTIDGIAEMVALTPRLTAGSLRAWIEDSRSRGAVEVHVIAASSEAQRAAIVSDLKGKRR